MGLYYYENGTLKSKNSFYEAILIKDSLYKNIFDGPKLEFYASGKIQSAEYYSMGKKNGRWERFSESGKLIMAGEYANNLEIGEHANWDLLGNLTNQCYYSLVKTDSSFISLKMDQKKAG